MSAKGESVSSNTDDLVFDDIPEKLKGLIGHHAKDAPKSSTNSEDSLGAPAYLPDHQSKDGKD